MKLSLIIPVYNVEKYVEQCIRSCENQDIPSEEYEIIVVNDGTKDNSLAIVEKLAQEYSNIKIFSQKNMGLSMARNNGLKQAKGDYIWFIDSDDWIEDNCLEDITQRLKKFNLEALAITAANVKQNYIERRMNWQKYENQIFSGRDFALKIGYSVCVPFTIYKRAYLLKHNLSFMPSIFHEDSEFTPRAYYKISKLSVYNKLVYFVRQNPNSITRSENPKKSFDLLKVAQSLSLFSQKTDIEYSKKISRNIITVINSSLLGAKYFSMEQLITYKKELSKNRNIFLHYIKNKNIIFKTEGVLFYLKPSWSINIYHFFNKILFHRK